MATSGSFTTPNNAGLGAQYPKYLQFNWWQNSQSTSGNYTDIGWNVVLTGGNSGSWVYVYGANVTVDGEYHDFSPNRKCYQGETLASGTKRIYHNSDGSKSFSTSGGGNIYYSSGRWSGGSGSWSLNTIPRHATIGNTSGNITDESTPWVEFSNPANANVNVWLEIINSDGSIAGSTAGRNNVSSRYTWTLTSAERDKLRELCANDNSKTLRYVVYDNFGGSENWSIKDTTLSIINADPTFKNFNYKDTNSSTVAVTNNDQILIHDKSDLAVTISGANKATANKKATIKTYTASISGLSKAANYTDNDLVISGFGTSFSSGQQILSVKATDSRGNAATVNKTVLVLDYSKPTISATAKRKNNFENETTLDISGTFSILNNGSKNLNEIKDIKYRYKNQASTNWSSWSNITSWTTENDTIHAKKVVLNLDNASAFTIEISMQDKLETITASLSVSVGVPIFRIGTDGNVYNNEKRILNVGDLPLGNSSIANSAITAEKIATSAFGGWKLLHSEETTASKSGTIFNFTIPKEYQKGCLFFATSFEMSTSSWNDMRAYDTSGNMLNHTVNTVYSRNGSAGAEGLTTCNYICAVDPMAKDRKITMTGLSIYSQKDSTWRHWQSFAGSGWQANYTSAFAKSGLVGSLRLVTGGTLKPYARIQIFGCI